MVQSLHQAALDGIAPWTDQVDGLSTFLVTVFRDKYPVTPGHLLFVPKDNTPNAIGIAMKMAVDYGDQLVNNTECDGYNVGLNSGEAAGQTVMYPHVHLIPRLTGDMKDPRGGVRHVIPDRGNYKKDNDLDWDNLAVGMAG